MSNLYFLDIAYFIFSVTDKKRIVIVVDKSRIIKQSSDLQATFEFCSIVAMEISPVERERVEFRGEVLVCLFSQIIYIYSQSDGSTSRGSL